MFSHERLDVYGMAVAFDAAVCKLLPRRGNRALRDQLERASSSVMACIAECAALLDALRNRGLINARDYQQRRELLLSIVRILTKLSAPPNPS